jgi:hypothetical protein
MVLLPDKYFLIIDSIFDVVSLGVHEIHKNPTSE